LNIPNSSGRVVSGMHLLQIRKIGNPDPSSGDYVFRLMPQFTTEGAMNVASGEDTSRLRHEYIRAFNLDATHSRALDGYRRLSDMAKHDSSIRKALEDVITASVNEALKHQERELSMHVR
jgi:hypothetical protein